MVGTTIDLGPMPGLIKQNHTDDRDKQPDYPSRYSRHLTLSLPPNGRTSGPVHGPPTHHTNLSKLVFKEALDSLK